MRDQKIFATIARYLQGELFPCGDLFSQTLSLCLYRLVAKGTPVTLEMLGTAVGTNRDAVAAAIEALAPSRLQHDAAGAIIAFAGLSQVPANHRFLFANRELFTWCVFDGLFLPQILDGRAEISSFCPVTAADILLRVGPDQLEWVEPEGAVMSFVMPDHESCCADLRGSFCNHVNFFASRQAGGRWLEQNTKAVILSLDDAFALGQIRNQATFKDLLGDQTHRSGEQDASPGV